MVSRTQRKDSLRFQHVSTEVLPIGETGSMWGGAVGETPALQNACSGDVTVRDGKGTGAEEIYIEKRRQAR